MSSQSPSFPQIEIGEMIMLVETEKSDRFQIGCCLQILTFDIQMRKKTIVVWPSIICLNPNE